MTKFLRLLCVLFVTLSAAVLPAQAVPVSFVYTDGAGEGFNDPTLGPARKACFEAATNNYASQFNGVVPLVVSASFDPLGGTPTSAVLGQAGPKYINRDWSMPGAAPPPQANTFYAVGLANQIAGIDLAPGVEDVTATFNSSVDDNDVLGSIGFYYGTDGKPGSNIDFYSVVLHEIGHGLGFLSIMGQDGTFSDTYPSSYDRFMQQGSTSLMSMTNAQRQAAVISTNLTFNGPKAIVGNGGSAPKLYAPNPYEPGSSVSHLDENTFTGINELMTPISSGVAHNIGPVATGVFQDIGWSLADTPQSGSTLVVNTNQDHDDGVCGTSDCSLREAIRVSNDTAGSQTITFNLAAGNRTITLASDLNFVTDSVAIQGTAGQDITLSGNGQFLLFTDMASTFTLQNLTIRDGNGGGGGGGFYNYVTSGTSTVTLTNCNFLSNTAEQGAGIFAYAQSGTLNLTVSNCTLSDNGSSQFGAGMVAASANVGSAASIIISGTTFVGNSAGTGGGLFVQAVDSTTSVSVTNSTFSNNTGTSYGGAIYNTGAAVTVNSVTFAGNISQAGAAVGSFNTGASYTSRNSLYSANNSSQYFSGLDLEETVVSQGNNLFSDAPDGFTAAGDQKNVNFASTLGALADNGGPTQTHALLLGSPALNAGATNLTTDQRGQARPQGNGVDVGAFESALAGLPTITSFTPGTGPTGTTVVITGTNFTSASAVKFNGTAATYTVNSATQITATVPAGATTGLIGVTTPGGTSNSANAFTVTAADSTPPTVAVTAPADGAVLK